jgi:tetratricopeptide (TPR) repeat protein
VNLRAALNSSCHALDDDTTALFSLLGVAAGPDISLAAAAALAGLELRDARALLDRLDAVYLVDHHVPSRYRMHDLTRTYAAERAAACLGEDRLDAALRRAVEFYVLTANLGDGLLDPQIQPILVAALTPSAAPVPLSDATDALAWFTAEHRCLLASQELAFIRNWDLAVWQLAWSLDSFHNLRGHLRDNVIVWERAVNAATGLRDPGLSALADRYFGRACARIGRHAEGLRHIAAALSYAEQHGDVMGQAHSHYSMACAYELQGNGDRALAHADQALELFRTRGNPVWESRMLTMVGWYHARLGHPGEARVHCEAALRAHR